MLPTSCCVMVLAPPVACAEDLVLERAGDADDVHAVVLVEALVLHGDERLRDVPWQRSKETLVRSSASDFGDE